MTVFDDNPDLIACAQMVERGDPDRFAATMAAPVAARAVLFPLYAFNLEVARAPWVTKEPMIAQMRLQWWLDALDEIAAGGFVRRHEVVTPLAIALAGQDVQPLRTLIRARERDIEKTPFDDHSALLSYLEETAGALAVAGAKALGSQEDTAGAIVAYGRAAGLARYLQAVPALEAQGKLPLPDGRPEALKALAEGQLAVLAKGPSLWRLRRKLGPAGAAVREFWQARALLQIVARDPACVAEGRLALSEFGRHWRLAVL